MVGGFILGLLILHINYLENNSFQNIYLHNDIYIRCVIPTPPETLPANWTYHCEGIPTTNNSDYFAYPDGSPCNCEDGCEKFFMAPSLDINPYAPHKTVIAWDTLKSETTATLCPTTPVTQFSQTTPLTEVVIDLKASGNSLYLSIFVLFFYLKVKEQKTDYY